MFVWCKKHCTVLRLTILFTASLKYSEVCCCVKRVDGFDFSLLFIRTFQTVMFIMMRLLLVVRGLLPCFRVPSQTVNEVYNNKCFYEAFHIQGGMGIINPNTRKYVQHIV